MGTSRMNALRMNALIIATHEIESNFQMFFSELQTVKIPIFINF